MKQIVWTTHEQAAREEARYFEGLSVTARVAFVETLRQRTPGIYDEGPPPRLERVFSLVALGRDGRQEGATVLLGGGVEH